MNNTLKIELDVMTLAQELNQFFLIVCGMFVFCKYMMKVFRASNKQ